MIQAIGESTALAVRGYAENYQMPGGRIRKRVADRVAIPTRHDGKRHRRLAKLERAAEVLAAWCLILGVAARCPRPGVLVDEQGEAISAEDLADMTGFPAELFELGIAALLDERIGWLVRVPLDLALAEDGKPEPERSGQVQAPRPEAAIPEASANDRADDAAFSPPDAEAETRTPSSRTELPDARAKPEANENARSLGQTNLRAGKLIGSMDPSELERIAEVEEVLFNLSLLGRISPDLYRSKGVTRRVLFDLWIQVDADKGIREPREAFIERLTQWVLNGQETNDPDAGSRDQNSPDAGELADGELDAGELAKGVRRRSDDLISSRC